MCIRDSFRCACPCTHQAAQSCAAGLKGRRKNCKEQKNKKQEPNGAASAGVDQTQQTLATSTEWALAQEASLLTRRPVSASTTSKPAGPLQLGPDQTFDESGTGALAELSIAAVPCLVLAELLVQIGDSAFHDRQDSGLHEYDCYNEGI